MSSDERGQPAEPRGRGALVQCSETSLSSCSSVSACGAYSVGSSTHHHPRTYPWLACSMSIAMLKVLDIIDARFPRAHDFARARHGRGRRPWRNAKCGLVVCRARLRLGVWLSRRSADRQLATAIWAGLVMLLANGGQPASRLPRVGIAARPGLADVDGHGTAW